MWTYNQANGQLSRNGVLVSIGYSGLGVGRNNPAEQDVHGTGPIPQGFWQIGQPMDTPNLGPHVMPLTPALETNTFGRGGFFIHGDSWEHPGQASHGCIILERPIRQEISDSGDTELEVV